LSSAGHGGFEWLSFDAVDYAAADAAATAAAR